VSVAEGYQNAIGIDMGGTSADVSIIRDGSIVRTTEGRIADLPVNTPMIDISTVGAGGGSIAWIDSGGALRVGPESAGADPGPICYGRGGERPTVTDANLLIGRIGTDTFLGGEMDLALDETRNRFEKKIADPLGESVEDAALLVIKVANARLAREIRRVTVERGHDPGNFAFVAFGGAGPLQAPAIAQDMDVDVTIVPRDPGVFSARGLLQADVRVDESHSYRGDGLDAMSVDEQFAALREDLLGRFDEQGIPHSDVTVERSVDVRYQGQAYEIPIDLPAGPVDDAALAEIIEQFHDVHGRRYGHAMADEPVEIVTLRASGHVPTPSLEDAMAASDEDPLQGTRNVYFEDDGYRETAVFRRGALTPGRRIEGPAILEGEGSTTLVPPDTNADVTKDGTVLITQ
jgi:N-methylhydantoinase A